MKGDGTSSCWVRCAFPWAGKNFGFISIPRVGHEVVVAFEEGDPDRPIIVGSVYNADMMPPWTLPDNKTQSGIQTRTEKGGSTNLNVFQFEDKKDAEFVFLHGEKDYHTRIKNDTLNMHGRDVHRQITRDLIEEIKNEVHRKVLKSVFEEITENLHTKIAGDEQRMVTGKVARKIDGALHDTIGADHFEKTTGKYHVKADEIAFEAASGISFKVGGCEVVIDTSSVSIKGSSKVAITGGMVNINSGPGSPAKTATAATAAAVTAPKAITEAMSPGETGAKTYSGTATPDTPRHALPATSFGAPSSQPVARAQDDGPAEEASPAAAPASTPASTTEEEQHKHYIEIQVNDQNGDPLPGEYFEIITPEGTLASGSTDDKGYARVDGIDPGNATITFPRRDKSVVE
jgi:phage baseplate assembly protein gpV